MPQARANRQDGTARWSGRAVTARGAVALPTMRPTLSVLSDDLLERILDEALRVLAETGMEIRGKGMRQRLLDAGLPTNAAGDRILFPRDVVERAIASAPKAFTLFDRDGTPLVTPGTPFVLDGVKPPLDSQWPRVGEHQAEVLGEWLGTKSGD